MHGRLIGKKCNKGGQHVLLLDSRRRYMYAWTPRHKFYPVVQPFTASGPAEVKRIVDFIRKIFLKTGSRTLIQKKGFSQIT